MACTLGPGTGDGVAVGCEGSGEGDDHDGQVDLDGVAVEGDGLRVEALRATVDAVHAGCEALFSFGDDDNCPEGFVVGRLDGALPLASDVAPGVGLARGRGSSCRCLGPGARSERHQGNNGCTACSGKKRWPAIVSGRPGSHFVLCFQTEQYVEG